MSAQELFQQANIWRAKELVRGSTRPHTSGYRDLDEVLDGGWPEAGMVEISYPLQGVGELNLLLPLLGEAKDHDANSRSLQVWINPPQGLQAQALAQAKVNLQQLLIVRCQNPQEALWAAEQSLQCPNCQQVVLWARQMRNSEARRLQCAAKENQALVFWLREHQQPTDALPITARLHIQPHQHGLQLQVNKLQGHWPKPDTCIHMHQQWPHLYAAPVPAPVSISNNVVPLR